jgi:rod shape-determining protein MreB and related proteins
VILGFLQSTVYVQLHPERLTVRHVQSGRSVSGPPIAAVSKGPKRELVAVGEAALTPPPGQPVELVNPFKHPRTLLADFTLGEQVLKAFMNKLFEGSNLFRRSPLVVLHPRIDPEGGFTQIELRALHELALGSGASKVILWKGRELSDEELREQKFSSGGEILEA